MKAFNPFHSSSAGFRTLHIFGCGGFGREVAWLAEQAWGDTVELIFLVDQPGYLRDSVNDRVVQLLSETRQDPQARYVVALGDPSQRRAAALACSDAGHVPAILVHPRAEMSRWIEIGEGAIVCAGCIATTNLKIGRHVHINLNCTIGHDVEIGNFSTLSPGVQISGHVCIGREVFVGTGACIINGSADAPLTIGDGAVIAAGACVTQTVNPGALVAGVPAVRKR